VRNSIEAMAEGEAPRELQVSTAPADGDGGARQAEVLVSDTGPGLAPEIQANLFQPFLTTKEKGMGLGLSICRSIVEAHGGRLQAIANPARGVSFRFTLPLTEQDEADAAR
jgi:two-component system sensor kinase FixL